MLGNILSLFFIDEGRRTGPPPLSLLGEVIICLHPARLLLLHAREKGDGNHHHAPQNGKGGHLLLLVRNESGRKSDGWGGGRPAALHSPLCTIEVRLLQSYLPTRKILRGRIRFDPCPLSIEPLPPAKSRGDMSLLAKSHTVREQDKRTRFSHHLAEAKCQPHH